MKNFYFINSTLLRAQPALVAFSIRHGSLKKQTVLLVFGLLLLSLNSYGQDAALSVTFQSANNGPWSTTGTWVYKNAIGNGTTVATRIPSRNDNVQIMQGHIVTVNTEGATCNTLVIEAGKTGNSTTGGQIEIGNTGVGKLSLTDLKFEIANGTPKERAVLKMGATGYLAVTGAISKINSVGQNQADNSADHSKINYNLNAASTIEYTGTSAQTIFNFYPMAGSTESAASTAYGNLILGGSGVKTPAAGLSIRGNLKINSGSAFNAGSFTHTVSGNWTNAGTFTASTSTVVMNGAVNADGTYKTISTVSTSSVTNAFNNITISNGSKKLLSTVYVKGVLDLDNISTTENKLFTESNRLDFSTTGSLARTETATQYIVGKVAADRTINNGNTGTSVAELYGNIGIRFTTSSPAPNVAITVIRTTGDNEQFDGKQSASRYFDIAAGTLAEIPNLVVELSFLQHELVESIDKYAVYRRDFKGDWFLRESAPYSNDNATLSYRYSLSNVSELGRYTIAAPPTILPVELAWFKAQRQGQGVLLTWETASEKENKGFEVQLSTDGKSFSKLAFVESKVMNSAVKQRYSYTDNATLASGTRYYRLAQVDLDGTTTYSNIKAVSLEAGPVAVKAFPNPFAEGQQVAVQLAPGTDRQVSLVLTNAMGQVVMQQQAQVEGGYSDLAVDVTAAKSTGMYLLSVVDGGSKHTFKLIKR